MFGLDDIGMGFLAGGAASALGSIGGSILSSVTGKQAGDREYGRQKEFAQNGIQWRVADAKAAGIHPIYAIGANTPTYSPQAAVGTDFGLSNAGQNIGRAIEAGLSYRDRQQSQAIANKIGISQADYYRAAANNQQAQADLAGQRAVAEAIGDIRGDLGFLGGSGRLSDYRLRTQPGQPPARPESMSVSSSEGIWGSDIPELSKVYAPDGRISALIISDKLHDAVEDIHLFESVPYIINGVQVGWKILNAKKDGAEFYGYRWHDESKQWIKNPNWRMRKPLSYDEAFNRHGYGYSKNRTSYHGRIR